MNELYDKIMKKKMMEQQTTIIIRVGSLLALKKLKLKSHRIGVMLNETAWMRSNVSAKKQSMWNDVN